MLQRVVWFLAGMALIPAATHAQSPADCRRLAIETVQLTGAAHLPDEVQEQLATALHGHEYDECSNWVNDLQSRVLRAENEAWPERESEGYMDFAVSVEWKAVSRSSSPLHIAVTIRVYEGRQKPLSEIEFRTVGIYSVPPVITPIIPAAELRRMIPLRDGEAFRPDKLHDGLLVIARAYGRRSFIDCSITSHTDVDQTGEAVRITLDLDEGPRYTVGTVNVAGLDAELTATLRSQIAEGDPVNPALIEKFYTANRARLPEGASPQNVVWQRDKGRAVVDLSFDFRGRTLTAEHQ